MLERAELAKSCFLVGSGDAEPAARRVVAGRAAGELAIGVGDGRVASFLVFSTSFM